MTRLFTLSTPLICLAFVIATPFSAQADDPAPALQDEASAQQSDDAQSSESLKTEKGAEKGLGKIKPLGKVRPLGKIKPTTVRSRSEIRQVMNQNKRTWSYCYERALLRQPKLTGKVIVEFKILGSGQVLGAKVLESTLNHPKVERCLQSRLQSLTFPKAKVNGIAVVKYPFKFGVKSEKSEPTQAQ